jgi:hypothetical protein
LDDFKANKYTLLHIVLPAATLVLNAAGKVYSRMLNRQLQVQPREH